MTHVRLARQNARAPPVLPPAPSQPGRAVQRDVRHRRASPRHHQQPGGRRRGACVRARARYVRYVRGWCGHATPPNTHTRARMRNPQRTPGAPTMLPWHAAAFRRTLITTNNLRHLQNAPTAEPLAPAARRPPLPRTTSPARPCPAAPLRSALLSSAAAQAGVPWCFVDMNSCSGLPYSAQMQRPLYGGRIRQAWDWCSPPPGARQRRHRGCQRAWA